MVSYSESIAVLVTAFYLGIFVGGKSKVPTYDYICKKCEASFELRLKFSDDVDQPCIVEGCGEIATRQFSAVPIVFKGGGWYVNDYGKKGSSSGMPAKDTSLTQGSDNKDSKPNENSDSSKKSTSEKKNSNSTTTKSSSDS
ncbi:MAG: FmdB family transcriptional regulator [SAR202 cluster bacterium]|nr:FmdB family transcriptional regulator [Chloroflexota bacterium]MQG22765.1 FmdB family transcriptional regulator [SAR202 cluster bacterium]